MLGLLGFEYRKPKALPRVADEDKQAEFIAFYRELIKKLPADKVVHFADAVHPKHQTKPAFGWVRKGSNPAVKTTAGRDRVNIHGAVSLKNFDVSFVEPVTVDGDSAVLKWSCFLGQVCGLAKMYQVSVHPAFRISTWTKYAASGVLLSSAV